MSVSLKNATFTCSAFSEALQGATDEILGAVKAAIRSALNKTVSSVKSLASSQIRETYNVPKAVLDERLTLFTARMQNLEAEIVFGGKGISLSYFGARQITVNRVITRKGKGVVSRTARKSETFLGVEVEVIRGHKTQLKSAFLAKMKSGHIGVMRRVPGKKMKGKNKQAIAEKAVISIASMVGRATIYDALVEKIDNDLEAKFLHELDYFLGNI